MTSQLCLAGECNQCWYCNQDCQEAHAAGLSDHRLDPTAPKQAHTPHLVPHRLTCPILKRFSSIKCDPAMESVIRMLLDAMALQHLEASSNLPHNSGAMSNPYVILLCSSLPDCSCYYSCCTHLNPRTAVMYDRSSISQYCYGQPVQHYGHQDY